jgi:spermidine synthase
MKPRELIGTATIPGGAKLRLFRRDGDFTIELGGNELMSSRVRGSEEALATETIARLGGRDAPHLLIGGYGMGFTLRAALAALGRDAQITLAEIVPEIIDWAYGPMQLLTDRCLDDPRVRLVDADVAVLIEAGVSRFDAILLDVDNGPDGLSRPGNDRIYAPGGLAQARKALKPGGVLAVWSAAPDASFTRRLRHAGFAVEEVMVRARPGKGPKHVIWFARAP